MNRGARAFWLVLLALLGASTWFGVGVFRMKAEGRAPAAVDGEALR